VSQAPLAQSQVALRVAVFHDNFAQMGGAERVAEALHRCFSQADLLTTLSIPEAAHYMDAVVAR